MDKKETKVAYIRSAYIADDTTALNALLADGWGIHMGGTTVLNTQAGNTIILYILSKSIGQ